MVAPGLAARVVAAATAALALYSCPASAADTKPAGTAPPFLPGPPAADDTGFRILFDGKSLSGWDGDPDHWRVEGSAIVGEVTEKTPLTEETFLIWRGGDPRDFELKAEYRVSDNGNSGLQYRSAETAGKKWAFVGGNQMDIDGRAWGEGFNARVLRKNGADCKRITGLNVGTVVYALPGQIVEVAAGGNRQVVGAIGTCDAVAGAIRDGWNEVRLIVRGGLMVHILNGQVMSVVLDEDPARAKHGRLGLQLHAGGPMKVEFRNVRIHTFDAP